MKVVLSTLLFLISLIGLGVRADGDTPSTLQLTILHTNDLHGHIYPFAYTETERSKEEQPSVGGAARRATLVRRLRNSIKHPVILVDGGDTFTRGPLTNAYEGVADVEAMNAVGYELAAIGNNEFKAKDARERGDAAGAKRALLRVVKHARFPWLCSNAFDEQGSLLEGVHPFVVRQWNGVRVGFLGLTAPRSASYPQVKGWKITDPIAAAQEWIPKARQECDVLVAVTHIGVDLDKELAAKTRGLDAIVGGDSHTFLYKAEEVANLDGVKVPIVQSGEFGVNLGRFDLTFVHDSAGKWGLKSYQYELLPIGPDIPEARDVARTVEPFRLPMMEVVGRLERVAETPEGRAQQTTQLMMDAIRGETQAEFALQPEMEGVFDTFHSRNITRFDIFAAMPFKNNVAIVEMTLKEVEDLQKKNPKTTISRDPRRLDNRTTYRVAMPDFIASSIYELPAERIRDTGRDLREVVIDYLRKRSQPRK